MYLDGFAKAMTAVMVFIFLVGILLGLGIYWLFSLFW